MDASCGEQPPVDASLMSLSIGRHADGEGRIDSLCKEPSPKNNSAWAMVQNMLPNYSSSSTESKRKRVNGNGVQRKEVCGLFSKHDACSMVGLRGTSSSLPKSELSQASSGSIFLCGVDEECSLTDLGLGLNGPMSGGGSFTSLLSGDRSVLTSIHVGVSQQHQMGHKQGVWPKSVIGLGSMDCRMAGNGNDLEDADAEALTGLGVQLSLGLSRSSTCPPNADNMSCPPVGLQCGGTYQVSGSKDVFVGSIPMVDEGSTSARSIKVGGYMPSLLMGRNLDNHPFDQIGKDFEIAAWKRHCTSQASNGEFGTELENNGGALDGDLLKGSRTASGTASSGVPCSASSCATSDRTVKTCKFRGCGKGARGASGLCITHGGGRRCQRQGCNKGAEGSTIYCKLHGGGRRCQSLGCTKSAEGKTDYCIAHGGGRRCSHDGCTKAARGRSGLCIRHGGGKRCHKEGCTKSAEGYSGLCISHGGGRRCQYEGCKKGAQGSTNFCKAHGGGKRCMIQGCSKGAEGSTPLCKGHGGGKRCMFEGGGICTKSVHGGTSFCVAHGGGKRCVVQGCTKSARGKTDFCVRHGGGKRCKIEGCTKSAQGSTDFCKAHGGGKRCCWGQEGSPYAEFVQDKADELIKGPCERFARGKLGLCAAHSALVQDRRVHGAGTIGSTLSSGIGPGLFRGLVEGSMRGGNCFEKTCKGSKLNIDEMHEHREHIGSNIEAAGVPQVKDDVEGLQPLSYTPGIKFNGTCLDLKEMQASNRINEEKVLISNFDVSSLWPVLSVPLQNTDMGSSKPYDVLMSESLGIKGMGGLSSGPRLASQRSILPPQVLVPLSMRGGGPFVSDQGRPAEKHVDSYSASGDGIIHVSSGGLHEQRVHGGMCWK